MHGPTYMANPLACAVALASLELLETGDWQADVARVEQTLGTALAPARQLPGIRDVRILGAIAVLELDHPIDIDRATQAAVAAGVWLRPFRNLIYAMPPYLCTEAELAQLAQAMIAAAAVA